MTADFYSIVYLVLDAVILIWIARMILNTRTIVLKTKTGFRWLVPLLFFVVAVITYIRNLLIGDPLLEDPVLDRKSTRLNSSHPTTSRMPSSA